MKNVVHLMGHTRSVRILAALKTEANPQEGASLVTEARMSKLWDHCEGYKCAQRSTGANEDSRSNEVRCTTGQTAIDGTCEHQDDAKVERNLATIFVRDRWCNERQDNCSKRQSGIRWLLDMGNVPLGR